jgi:hypothetical protein
MHILGRVLAGAADDDLVVVLVPFQDRWMAPLPG